MNTVYNNDKIYNTFFALAEKEDVLSDAKGQLLQFYHWLYDKDFLRNLTKDDYEWIAEEGELGLSILTNHKISIGIDVWRDYVRIGIDPSNCFDKVSKCSILVRLPLSKREEQSFYNTLDKILDKKSKYSKTWFAEASRSYYGSFASFGDIC